MLFVKFTEEQFKERLAIINADYTDPELSYCLPKIDIKGNWWMIVMPDMTSYFSEKELANASEYEDLILE